MNEIRLYEDKMEYKKLVIEKDQKEIARCYVFFIKNNLHNERYALIEDVFVDEKYRGHGLGTVLVKKAIELAKEEGCYKIILTSRFGKEHVHQWYEKLGFKKWGYEFRIDLV